MRRETFSDWLGIRSAAAGFDGIDRERSFNFSLVLHPTPHFPFRDERVDSPSRGGESTVFEMMLAPICTISQVAFAPSVRPPQQWTFWH